MGRKVTSIDAYIHRTAGPTAGRTKLRQTWLTTQPISSLRSSSCRQRTSTQTLDPSVADNSKLIFIAPDYEDSLDPFQTTDDRLVLVERGQPAIDLAPLFNEVSQATHQAGVKFKMTCVNAMVLSQKARLQTTTIAGEVQDVLLNPDQMLFKLLTQLTFHLRRNINGGDSGAYWFNIDDPTYMLNFKMNLSLKSKNRS